jgi:hypothetical protein
MTEAAGILQRLRHCCEMQGAAAAVEEDDVKWSTAERQLFDDQLRARHEVHHASLSLSLCPPRARGLGRWLAGSGGR